ncbi:unnamed protein product [Cyprideis torosa]|uniref:Uncharacterized protein n=1 Tax=Cyprideis torosa TaxID=163714 RepID=A0A7R8WE78_9CRUS|nr:unnamed protein product [Cyprideis torosa]CAG0889149.1 unnamed protein product [Cyprideis torosa]
MYQVVNERRSDPDEFKRLLADRNIIPEAELEREVEKYWKELDEHLKLAETYEPTESVFRGAWWGFTAPTDSITTWNTGTDIALLKFVGRKSVSAPEGPYKIHPHLEKTYVRNRLERITKGKQLDWATAEALAFGSLIYQGYGVRLCGQDVGRGTFSQRHAMMVDPDSAEIYVPLNHLDSKQSGFLEVCNSPLSEEAVLAFEYGFSVGSPHTLCIWEAQFGDFFNGAQVIIDTFVCNGESKWLIQSGIVLLLPHGMDGAGPEHSSCRIERWLQMTDSSETKVDGDDINFVIANPTTPAQYFHLLRRQMLRPYRKPLIVASPKTILRLPTATSSLNEMASGTSFQPVLDDPVAVASEVERLVFCSGKHYYALAALRAELGDTKTALVRVEELSPFPIGQLQEIVNKYNRARTFIWSQEEHRNGGPWNFVNIRFQNLLGLPLKYIGRKELATPATGIAQIHSAEAKEILNATFSS